VYGLCALGACGDVRSFGNRSRPSVGLVLPTVLWPGNDDGQSIFNGDVQSFGWNLWYWGATSMSRVWLHPVQRSAVLDVLAVDSLLLLRDMEAWQVVVQ